MKEFSIEKAKIEEKESKEKEPQLEIEFVLAPHGEPNKEEIQALKEEIKKYDIICPELPGWHEEIEEDINLVSRGLISPEAFNEKRYKLREYWAKVLYKSKKFVKFVDIERAQLSEDPNLAFEQLEYNSSNNLFEYFPKVTKLQNETIEKIAKLTKGREEIISKNTKEILPALKRYLKKPIYPADPRKKLMDKKKLKAMIRLGMGHTYSYMDLKKEKQLSIKRKFKVENLPIVYSFTNELIRKKLFYPEKKLTEEEIIKSLIEPLITKSLIMSTKDYFNVSSDGEKFTASEEDFMKIVKIGRFIISSIDYKDIQKIPKLYEEHWNKLSAFDRLMGKQYEAKNQAVQDFLKEQKITLPKNKTGLNKLAGEYDKKFGIKKNS